MSENTKTKVCIRCLQPKPVEEFQPRNKNNPKYRVSYCQDCLPKYKAEYHAKTRDSTRSRKKDRITRNRKYIIQYLLEHPCIDCGESDPIVLDFDHITGKKVDDVCVMAHNGVGLESLQKEIDKCVVRCANDHRRKTCKEGNHWRLTSISR